LLQTPRCGDKSDFQALMKCKSDAPEHRQRMAVVIGIFQAANDRRRGADKLRQLALGYTHPGSKLINSAGDLGIYSSFVQFRLVFRLFQRSSDDGGFRRHRRFLNLSVSQAITPDKYGFQDAIQTSSCDEPQIYFLCRNHTLH
jgi:hypothetical protein